MNYLKMFRTKILFGRNLPHFLSKVQNLTVISIVYMIRIRCFGPAGINSESIRDRTVRLTHWPMDMFANNIVVSWKNSTDPQIAFGKARRNKQ